MTGWKSWQRKKCSIDHIIIQEIHEIVTRGILEDAGRYRTRNVRITGAVKSSPDWSKIAKLMDELIEKITENSEHPIETASFLHHRFVEIHPFSDGNGRVARLLTNLYLIARDYPLSCSKKRTGENTTNALELQILVTWDRLPIT
ncbi:Fic family protein [Methanosarcina horonobensis]|uniref:Fic family protein n=1 Tax=Methanosarcina horonobensis TaxID=418008 RepID=UPI0022B8FAD5|nr:Fic family protein [Methanosarcina horonobensis]